MVGIYFSGTGNSKYAAELFCKEYDKEFSVGLRSIYKESSFDWEE